MGRTPALGITVLGWAREAIGMKFVGRMLAVTRRNKIRKLSGEEWGYRDVLSHLMTLQMPEGLDLFPVSVYGWLNTPEDQPNCDILVTVTAAVTVGAEDCVSLPILRPGAFNMPGSEDNCAKCSRAFFGRQRFIWCSGPCKARFHLDCLKINDAEYELFMKSGVSTFKCDPCIKKAKASFGDATLTKSTSAPALPEWPQKPPQVKKSFEELLKAPSADREAVTIQLLNSLISMVYDLSTQVKDLSSDNVVLKAQISELLAFRTPVSLVSVGTQCSLSSQSSKPIESSPSTSYISKSPNSPKLTFSQALTSNKKSSVVESKSVVKSPAGAQSASASADDGFTVVSRRKNNSANSVREDPPAQRSRARKLLTGNKTATDLQTVNRVFKKKSLFVTRFSPEISSLAIQSYLTKELNLDYLVCSKLKTKFNSYSSFHISVKEDDFPMINNGDIWPSGCLIAPFYGKLLPEQIICEESPCAFGHLLENNSPDDSTDESRLKHLIKLVKLAKIDLQKAVEFYEKLFLEALHFSYATTLYTIYEKKISELTEEVVTEVCKTLKPLKFNDRPGDDIYDNDPLTMGTTLFELYLILQSLGSGLSPEDCGRFQISQFHTWFHRGVAQWLDIALYKALQRIHKAVELDELEPVDVSVKYSSSAVDTLAIYYQDICRCSVFYADKMSKKVEGMGETQSIYEKKFEVTTEWCLAINNIEYVRQSIVPFVNELGMEEIVTSLGDYRTQNAADHCRKTLQLVIDNAVETVGNKILELLETVAEKMTPSINRFLMEGAELLNQDCNTVDRLMKYLDDNLVTLHSQLNVDNFDRILAIIWEKLSLVMYALVESNLEKRRPPSFFANLSETLKVLVSFFRQGDESVSREWNNEVLQKMEHLLLVHGLETSELIHQYFKERLMAQRDLETPSLGILTIRLQFVEDILRVEIMNARNIRPMDSNGVLRKHVTLRHFQQNKHLGKNRNKGKEANRLWATALLL
uniref:Zinc finger PHD-type domain-containing protein n=1 Tax=Timema douglasi TaxID=61478 RepID=A0A7R8ZCP8_TIMDO|nr:unnamed protein product [Timema douglasi]